MRWKLLLELVIFVICCASNVEATTFDELEESAREEVHHRSRRAVESQHFPESNLTYYCDLSVLPQPTEQYPVILFEYYNYNNCSRNGKYLRLRTNIFEKWSENLDGTNRAQKHKWLSMLILPGSNVTFRACCPSGNNFVSVVSNWNNTANIHLSVLSTTTLKGSQGIWYEKWLHWVMNFYIRVNEPVDTSSLQACGTCYFGQCGLTGNCECDDGYSGNDCSTRPTNDTYPTEKKPLVLFTQEDFQGTYLPVSPNDFKRFAYNVREAREMIYKSLRVLHNRTLTFARNIIYTTPFSPGSDIANIPEFMLANTNIADRVWYSYDKSYEVDFYVRVDANNRCFNCSITGGVCYTGNCVCLNGYQGQNCDQSV